MPESTLCVTMPAMTACECISDSSKARAGRAGETLTEDGQVCSVRMNDESSKRARSKEVCHNEAPCQTPNKAPKNGPSHVGLGFLRGPTDSKLVPPSTPRARSDTPESRRTR